MNHPDTISQTWDSSADAYERTMAAMFVPFAAELVRLAGVRAAQSVLDVAAGTGVASFAAARLGAKVTAIDFSSGMLTVLEKRRMEQGVRDVTAMTMDGQALEFPDNTFDVAFSNFGLIFFPDRAKGLREMFRVLKPGGTAAISAWKSVDTTIGEAIKRVLPNLPQSNVAAPVLSLKDPVVLKTEMEQAGFTRVRVHDHIQQWKSANASEYWNERAPSSRTLQDLLKRVSKVDGEVIRNTAIEILQSKYGSGEVQIPWPSHIGVGAKDTTT